MDTDFVSDFRSELSACGFRVATMAFSGFAGHPCYHARTVVAGEYLDVAWDTITERVTVIGTPDVLTLADAVERFRPPADAPALPWLDRVKLAGFRDVRWDTSPLGERYNLRHYSATRADGSRWLILAESESLLCHSDRPWSSWKLGRDGGLMEESRVERPESVATAAAAPVIPAKAGTQQQQPARSMIGLDATPVEHSGRNVQVSLF